jgi:hypothetical protein
VTVYVYTADTVTEEYERVGARCHSRTVEPCHFPDCGDDHRRRCSRAAGHPPDVHVCVQRGVVTAVWVVKR